MPVVDALVAAAETVVPVPGPLRGAPAEEVALIYRWMTEPGARIVSTTDPVALPAGCAERRRGWSQSARDARSDARSAVHRTPRPAPRSPVRELVATRLAP